MTRQLVVWLDELRVGRISEENDIWSFVYDSEWDLYDGKFNISPHINFTDKAITDGSTQRTVQWFFDNLLPEEGAREVLSKEVNINVSDSFGLLEYYGAESAGALTLLPKGKTFKGSKKEILISNAVLSSRIQNLPQFSLNYHAPKKMSLAGAQNKLAVSFDASCDAIYEPSNKGTSSHILKPDHTDPEAYYNSTVNEWFIMQLAKNIGLPVPPVYLKFVPEPVFIIERFDRQITIDGGLSRKHMVDGCQMLNLSRSNKYHGATVENLATLIAKCRSKALARASIFNWVLFNILIGNDDAHLKNLSFFIGVQGIELAPFYDLLSTSIYHGIAPLESEMAYALNGAKYFADVNKDAIIKFAEEIGVNHKAASMYLQNMAEAIGPAFDDLYQQFESMQLPKDYSPYKMSALRMLREIKYNVLQEMLSNTKV